MCCAGAQVPRSTYCQGLLWLLYRAAASVWGSRTCGKGGTGRWPYAAHSSAGGHWGPGLPQPHGLLCRHPVCSEQTLLQPPERVDQGGASGTWLSLCPTQPRTEGHLQPTDPSRASKQEAGEGDGEGIHTAVPGATWHRLHS